ncbi:MAG: DUF3990 domain-containing protein [Planctomycetaceae bacterium]|nr:DUF3990 domain-containing protein [Planctomycetaceae bacterium]
MVFCEEIGIFREIRTTQSWILFHGGQKVVEFPEIRTSRFHKDFYFSFYCTKPRSQAIRWAVRRGGNGLLNRFHFTPNETLRILQLKRKSWMNSLKRRRSCRANTIIFRAADSSFRLTGTLVRSTRV